VLPRISRKRSDPSAFPADCGRRARRRNGGTPVGNSKGSVTQKQASAGLSDDKAWSRFGVRSIERLIRAPNRPNAPRGGLLPGNSETLGWRCWRLRAVISALGRRHKRRRTAPEISAGGAGVTGRPFSNEINGTLDRIRTITCDKRAKSLRSNQTNTSHQCWRGKGEKAVAWDRK
jgi:hypothetical protein